jgi:hypothetical protein
MNKILTQAAVSNATLMEIAFHQSLTLPSRASHHTKAAADFVETTIGAAFHIHGWDWTNNWLISVFTPLVKVAYAAAYQQFVAVAFRWRFSRSCLLQNQNVENLRCT